MQALADAMGESLNGEGRTVFLSGEAGVGKTRLAEELQAMAEAAGMKCLIGGCMPTAAAPYLPFQEMVMGMDGPARERLTASFNETGQSREIIAQRVSYTLLTTLAGISDEVPLLIRLEDLHWADTPSVGLMHFLARKLGRSRVMILGTYRSEEIGPRLGNQHPLAEALSLMRKEGLARDLPLCNLGEEESAKLAERVLGRIDKGTSEEIWKASEGNPLFVLETARFLRERPAGTSRFFSQVIPPTVRDVVARRLERLGSQERRAVDAAAVLGLRFRVEDVGKIAGTVGAVATLADLADRTQIVHASGGWGGFQHEVIRQVCYDRMDDESRRRLHLQAGQLLEMRGAGAAELAEHFYRGGDRERAARFCLEAGSACLSRAAMEEALPYFRRVLEVEDEGGLDSRWGQAQEGMAESYYWLTCYPEAAEIYDRLLAKARTDEEKGRILHMLRECWNPSLMGKGSLVRYREYLEMGRGLQLHSAERRAEWAGDLAYLAYVERDFEAMLAKTEDAAALYLEAGNAGRYAWEMDLMSFTLLIRGRPGEAIEKAHLALQAYEEHPLAKGMAFAYCNLGEASLMSGRCKDGVGFLEKAAEKAEECGSHAEACYDHYNLALCYYRQGMLPQAKALAMISREEALRFDYPLLVALPCWVKAIIELEEGRMEEAETDLAEAEKAASDGKDDVSPSPLWGMVRAVRAMVLAARECWPESEVAFAESLELLDRANFRIFYSSMVLSWRAEARRLQGRTAEAASDLREAIDRVTVLGDEGAAVRLRLSLQDVIGEGK